MVELLAEIAELLAEVGEPLDALDQRVAKLEAEPRRKAPTKADEHQTRPRDRGRR